MLLWRIGFFPPFFGKMLIRSQLMAAFKGENTSSQGSVSKRLHQPLERLIWGPGGERLLFFSPLASLGLGLDGQSRLKWL